MHIVVEIVVEIMVSFTLRIKIPVDAKQKF